MLSINTSNIFY